MAAGTFLQIAHVAPPLSLLRRGGRLVVVGDTRQMGPILQNEYPAEARLCDGAPPPHWSLLRWLWVRAGADEVRPPRLQATLLENHRMGPGLAHFTQRVLGYEGYHECRLRSRGFDGCSCHAALPGGAVPPLQLSRRPGRATSAASPPISASALDPQHPFVLIELGVGPGTSAAQRGAAAEPMADALETEAALVAELISDYLAWRGTDDDEDCFVVTPHHAQRRAVRRHLAAHGVAHGRVRVNTVEKMQGQECDLVIVCYGGLVELDSPAELDFVYGRERLNVAVTRARKKTILISSAEVLRPSLAACATAERAAGFELLGRIAAHCCIRPQPPPHGCIRLLYRPDPSPPSPTSPDPTPGISPGARTPSPEPQPWSPADSLAGSPRLTPLSHSPSPATAAELAGQMASLSVG